MPIPTGYSYAVRTRGYVFVSDHRANDGTLLPGGKLNVGEAAIINDGEAVDSSDWALINLCATTGPIGTGGVYFFGVNGSTAYFDPAGASPADYAVCKVVGSVITLDDLAVTE